MTRVAVAGAVVKFICTLDETCVNRSFQWSHYSAFDTRPVTLYNGRRLNPMLESSGVSVEEDRANGRSVLTIPRATLEDSGRFHCHVTGLKHCQMNFQLTVTGNICVI